ncbi:hypothetical protein [Asanoa iriomotensis]|uniref:Uncharacterized protein n=1 Tax=Asanoa iriomotensis TaxID=234613 RepID=A0ABQ4CGG4_9ACTN|nr:hypothetical protein [Asanoa iriomotensis]GIF61405.1 hypothetical protein Air01nite_75000 [Asanoa iriomotensis]
MPNNNWDAAIKQLYPADDGTKNFAEMVSLGKAFDVIASVEIGKNLREFVDGDRLTVTVINHSKMAVVTNRTVARTLVPQSAPLTEDLKVDIDPGWTADEGDVLEAVATYKAQAGIHTDFSSTTSHLFTVVP